MFVYVYPSTDSPDLWVALVSQFNCAGKHLLLWDQYLTGVGAAASRLRCCTKNDNLFLSAYISGTRRL